MPGERPDWWPEGDPWPPPETSGAAWILRRLLLTGLGLLALLVTAGVILGFVLGGRDHRGDGPPPFAAVFFVLLFVGAFLLVSRTARRFGNPLGQVMSGLDRLAAGQYDTRVKPSGPPPVRALGEALNTTAGRLQAAEEQRRSLVADIAHEVRTPLAVIRGNAEGMVDGLYKPDPSRLRAILDEVEVIARLVDDLSTLSSAEAGMLRIHREPTDMAHLLRDVASSFEAQAAAKGVKIRVEASVSAIVEVDAQRMRGVLENLVSNALRHTESGDDVRLELRDRDRAIEVAVVDTGSGIAPEELAHIFERYRKGPDSSGSGLGLAIAKRLVEAHGGTIGARSEVGAGTTISFVLPASSLSAKSQA